MSDFVKKILYVLTCVVVLLLVGCTTTSVLPEENTEQIQNSEQNRSEEFIVALKEDLSQSNLLADVEPNVSIDSAGKTVFVILEEYKVHQFAESVVRTTDFVKNNSEKYGLSDTEIIVSSGTTQNNIASWSSDELDKGILIDPYTNFTGTFPLSAFKGTYLNQDNDRIVWIDSSEHSKYYHLIQTCGVLDNECTKTYGVPKLVALSELGNSNLKSCEICYGKPAT